MPPKRERIDYGNQQSRYIRRDPSNGQFLPGQVGVGPSLARDNDQRARRDNPGGQGDRGDRRR